MSLFWPRFVPTQSNKYITAPDGDIPLTLFLKTESNDDYIVFFRTELRDVFSDTNSDIEKLTFCEVPATDAV